MRIAVTVTVTRCLHIGVAVTLTVTRCLHIGVAVTVTVTRCLHMRVAVTVTVTRCLHIGVAVTVTFTRCLHMRVAVTVTVTRCLHMRVTVTVTVTRSLHMRVTVTVTVTRCFLTRHNRSFTTHRSCKKYLFIYLINMYLFLNMGFHGKALLVHRPIPKLEDHLLSAVRDSLFNLFAATLHIAGRSSIRNLRTRNAVVTGTHNTG